MLSKISTMAGLAGASYSGHGGYGSEQQGLKDDCSNFNGNLGCTDGSQTRYPDDWSKRSFQTFIKDGPDAHMYKPGYEDLARIMCYNNVEYAGDRQSAKVTATCRKHDSIQKMEYNFNNEGFVEKDNYDATTALTDTLTVAVRGTDNDGKEWNITVEPSNFIWQNA